MLLRQKEAKEEVMTISEMIGSSKYFHGTSNVYLRNIQQHGIKINEKGRLYLTTNPFTAQVEAFNTVIGDLGYGITSWPPKPKEIKSPGTGGKAVVIELDPKYIDSSKLRPDPEYPSEDQAYYIDYDLPAQAIININILGSEPGRDIIDYWMGV